MRVQMREDKAAKGVERKVAERVRCVESVERGRIGKGERR